MDIQVDTPETTKAPSPAIQRQLEIWRIFIRNRKASIGMIVVGSFVLLAIFGPIIIRQDPHTFTTDVLQSPSGSHWFGTTNFGEDVLVQTIIGARFSVFMGLGIGLITTIISVLVGLTSGYFLGWIDEALSLLTNVFLVLPTLPLAILLAAFLPNKGPFAIGFILTITGWSWGARVLRSQTLSLRNRDCVEASRASGESIWRIIFYEILPNQTAIVAAQFFGTVTYVILAETALEYLGLGDITASTWGNMLFSASTNSALLRGAWWWFLPPGLCIAILGAALTFINFGIDEIANPRLRNESGGVRRLLKKFRV
ncbi:peptide ABC transporter permease [Reticulibacter mediterranei]|uniref:Peptide ABC transporter permease n=1 Tax=Reticulibacter mediterranei TaxID=2778369 RepID=A0A8J3MZU0_9CHLR|nr:peptide ABC transporter permease [Reticulibacter mediterranei]